jgi:GTP-binding protein Era
MKAGIVTVCGKPNAGKSTLLNRIIGQKLSITSPKPQSTRDRIVGIHTEGDVQMVIFDTPGLLVPSYTLQRAMRATALKALEEADVIVYVVDASAGGPEPLEKAAQLDRAPRAPVILAFNKSDALDARAHDRLSAQFPDALFISALTGDGIPPLLTMVAARLPDSPFLYPEDELSTQSMRFFVAELVRETALEQLSDEVPYSVACEIEEFRETTTPVYIRAVLYVERDSQKGILIGDKGSRIRAIGTAARGKIEALVGSKVYLDLHVKVLANWRRNAHSLKRFGFKVPEGEGTQ